MNIKEQNRAALNANLLDYMKAYADAKKNFNLKAAQRDMLDASPLYVAIMEAAKIEDWSTAEALLRQAEIIK